MAPSPCVSIPAFCFPPLCPRPPSSRLTSLYLSLKYDVIIRQQPLHARISAMKISADRRPVDPPIVVQLNVTDLHGSPAARPATRHPHLTNPYYFMYAALVTINGDTDIKCEGGRPSTSGALVSSVRVLKDHPNSDEDAAFFIFPDICVRLEGSWRFKLSLFVIDCDMVKFCAVTFSQPFFVYPGKLYPGVQVSTPLTRALAAQGVKLRIRKEVRASDKPAPASTSATSSPAKTELLDSPLQSFPLPSLPAPPRLFPQSHAPAQDGNHNHDISLSSPPWFYKGNDDMDIGRSPPKRRRTLTIMRPESASASGPSSPTDIRMDTGSGRMLPPVATTMQSQLPPPMLPSTPGSFDGFGLGLGLGLTNYSVNGQKQQNHRDSQHFRRSSHGSIDLGNASGNARATTIPFGSLPARPLLPPPQQWTTRIPLPEPEMPLSFDFTLHSSYNNGNGRASQGQSDPEFDNDTDEREHNHHHHNNIGSSGMSMYAGSAPPATMSMPISIFQSGHDGSSSVESEDDLELDLDLDSVGTGSTSSGYSWSSSSPLRESGPSTPALPLPGSMPPAFWPSAPAQTYPGRNPHPFAVEQHPPRSGWPGVIRAAPVFGAHAF
ncbi:velvet factor-domain-containing protein [Mycena amicta]|nr:velvet factor-domain-containing protein [Mycena amicta]